MTTTRRLLLILAVVASPHALPAQGNVSDTLRLDRLHTDAVQRDPRNRQIELLRQQSSLRLRNIDAERFPALGVNGQAQYQSSVASIPVVLPGVVIPQPAHDTYDASVGARQKLFDPTMRSRRLVERAQLADNEARIHSGLFTMRQSVNETFFTILELQSRRHEIETSITDLTAQKAVSAARVREGAALAGEERMLEAELLRQRQTLSDLISTSEAAKDVLAQLTGRRIAATADLVFPDLAAATAGARASLDSLRARPEFEQFTRLRGVLATQAAATNARELPRVSAFARAGYGRPGLNPLASEFDTYWLAGVQFEWNPWSWGSTRRDREVLSLQQEIVKTEEASLRETLRRLVVRDLAAIDRLERALVEDEAIVSLREAVLREARPRFREGVITSAEYIDRQTDVLSARLALASHRVELAEARARFLTTIGLEVRP
jgi:outer membrane protein TolC